MSDDPCKAKNLPIALSAMAAEIPTPQKIASAILAEFGGMGAFIHEGVELFKSKEITKATKARMLGDFMRFIERAYADAKPPNFDQVDQKDLERIAREMAREAHESV